MAKTLNVLIVEDSKDDADLLIYELGRAGYDPHCACVQTEAEFAAELTNKPDIILSDYSLPQFSGLRAAELARESGLEIPFILVSGTVGEDVAVNAMRHGATDYLLKDRLIRLGQAVDRALLQAKEHAEKKQTESSLRLFRTLIDKSSDGIEVIDPATGRFLDINETSCQRLGYSRPELLSMLVFNVDPQINQAAWPQLVDDLRKKQSLVVEGWHRRKDNTTFPVEVNIRWVQLDREYIVNVVRDITERRKLQAQFFQAQKMESIGQLAGGVAHDFNNILSVIQIQSSLLKGSRLSAEQSEYADEIIATVRRAAALTRQLLLFSRREIFQPRDLDLNESIVNITKMLQRVLGENIRMELKPAPQPMYAHADPGMIDQVLMNLTVNARDAMPQGGQLVIETFSVGLRDADVSGSAQARPGPFICLSVRDTGCGIPSEVLPRIFEPFFTTKDVGKGTGLGLATVFGIVQQHQGWVEASSQVGRGSTFRIFLPQLPQGKDPKSLRGSLERLRGGKETILLVEDDPSLRMSVAKTLSQLGYRVLEAPTGRKALQLWKQNPSEIAALLTDLIMPDGMTGKDLAGAILQDNPKLKVIYMSGYSAELGGEDFPLEEGVNFLAKPFQALKLANILRSRLDE